MFQPKPRRRITIAILALGGQGGGVLADWILHAGEHSGYLTQGTSVPGVAQRTGTTVYYIEMVPVTEQGYQPILALMPVPGDVDVVIASELMEAGRAMVRGFVTQDLTTLIASTHRVYSISEKSAMGDGTADPMRILEAAARRSKQFIGFDMDAAAAQCGSVISSVMLGALAGSGVLPFGREAFTGAIEHSGIAVAANLRGFEAGWKSAQPNAVVAPFAVTAVPQPTTEAGRRLADRVRSELPAPAQVFATEGVRRLMDYQDGAYAGLYLDRLARVRAADDGSRDWEMTRETARYLALWMSYEDTIRVADLKTRASRVERVRGEVQAKPDQVLGITEFMHPRFQEVCETIPSRRLGKALLNSAFVTKLLAPLFANGRHVQTTRLHWFLVLKLVAGLRPWRRATLRFHEEGERIEAWLALVVATAATDPDAAREIVQCQRMIKGYGDTFERGLRNYAAVVSGFTAHSGPGGGALIRRLREAALADEGGEHLAAALSPRRAAS
jgi:indolepyruvate ferredoxin oxidoreductase beta subunit